VCLREHVNAKICLQGYDNTESSVRKASVFCLVAIYSVIGEELKPHLAQLTGSEVCSHVSKSTKRFTPFNLLITKSSIYLFLVQVFIFFPLSLHSGFIAQYI